MPLEPRDDTEPVWFLDLTGKLVFVCTMLASPCGTRERKISDWTDDARVRVTGRRRWKPKKLCGKGLKVTRLLKTRIPIYCWLKVGVLARLPRLYPAVPNAVR
ncbi:hypothetical protein GWI33_023022 [Rhynchophorus ferrugineus]|uniref:Uncharacterized protein n=1 Tax=Rhynchophorus ferrugineus TaxID=354439 RepID=A0A834IPZ8_RHYFE|nr:hypothetical protein GWI33_023022 [Rhynchophorus ferrugineus]